MNRQLTSSEIAELSSPIPITMTRKQKLLHWAALIRKSSTSMILYSNLEYQSQSWFDAVKVRGNDGTAFGLAVIDPTFNQAGLVAEGASISTVMGFFELSKADLHEFSCDCGGIITNQMMADRIEHLAA